MGIGTDLENPEACYMGIVFDVGFVINIWDGSKMVFPADKLPVIDSALEQISNNRAFLGAQQSRLNSTVSNLGIQVENTASAHSRVRDVDFAEVTATFTQNRILQQGGASVLAQANLAPELALSLLR